MKKLLIPLLAAAALCAGCGVNTNPGTFSRTGEVVMLRKEGIFSKTWECEILKGGLNGGSGGFGQPFYFTIERDSDAQAIQDAMDKQREVCVKGRTEGFFSEFRSSSGGDFLDSFTVITNSGAAK